MAKITRVTVEQAPKPYFELVATTPQDVRNYGGWVFKIKPFRYCFIPHHEILMQRWVQEIDQNLRDWTQNPRIKDIVSFIRGGSRKRFILYEILSKQPLRETPGYVAFYDPEMEQWVAPVTIQKLAIKQLEQLERALERGIPVSLAGGMYNEKTGEAITFDAVLRAIELRAHEVIEKKLIREGVYHDPSELLVDAAWHRVEVQDGTLNANEIYRDEAMMYRVFDWLIAILERRGFIAPGDVMPTPDDLQNWLAVDVGRLKRELNEDILFGLPGHTFWQNLLDYTVQRYSAVA